MVNFRDLLTGELVQRVLPAVQRGAPRFPAEFLVFDIETSGKDPEYDKVCEVAYAYFRNGELAQTYEAAIDWLPFLAERDPTGRELEAFVSRLTATARSMHRNGFVCEHDLPRLAAEGLPPATVLGELRSVFEAAVAQGWGLVCHNGVRFDVLFLETAFARDLGSAWYFPPDAVYDTGAIAFTEQVDDPEAWPQEGEAAGAWAVRALSAYRPDVRWSLHEYCAPRYGIDLDGSPHTAAYDVAVTGLVAMRQLALAGVSLG